MDELRAVMLGMTVAFMLITLPGYYFGVYSTYKYRPERHSGRMCSADLQGGLAAWTFTILFAYLVMPAFGPQLWWQGSIRLMFGGWLMEAAVLTWHTHKVLHGARRRYQFWLASAVLVAASGLLLQGVLWLFHLPLLPWVDSVGLIGSLIILIICEAKFLRANKWRLLPDEMK
ncbi:MAG: hypothetical protein GX139_12595 [Armatimonadetes bacterium]|nr:hypothetical protein [Armatimonadota bacterium]